MKILKTILCYFTLFAFVHLAIGSVAQASNFSDTTNHKYKNAIQYIADKGIVEGYADNTFKPDELINRAEFLKIILESNDIEVDDNFGYCFLDVKTAWYAKYVCKAKDLGIISGYPDGTFQSSNEINLVEALKIIEETYGANLADSEVWYKTYIDEASSKNLIPLDISSFDQKLTRGQMADIMTRYLKYKDGTQAEYLKTSFGTGGTKIINYEVLAKNKNTTGGNMPPDEAIAACADKSTGDACEFDDKGETAQGTCNDNPGVMACAPDRDEGDKKPTSTGTQGGQKPTTNTTPTNVDTSEFSSCINNTKDAPECKDCCDCLTDTDGSTRTACRDACAVEDFSDNSNYITVSAPSTYGANGDYSQCTDTGSSSECKSCCEGSMGLQCGDYRHCRTACNNEFGGGKDTGNAIGGNQGGSNYYDPQKSSYSIEQAISDRAQENTIAYDALAFFTGNTCADSFIPPGKVADFFGYQHLRDTTQAGMGHSTDFVTNSANNVLYILNDDQKQQMIDLAKSQVDLVNEYAYGRYPLLVAFRRQLEGDIPAGTTGLSKEAVIEYSEELYLIDAEISMQRAKLFGDIIRSLDDEQIEFLDAMVEGGFDSWTPRDDQVDKKSLSHDEHVLVMTYASEMFGWYAGNVEADTYFCPERHGTYFGSFYMKDAPAMGNQGYVIDETITGNKGEMLLNYLEDDQSELISDLVDIQKDNLEGIVDVREAISTELRKYMTQSSIDEDLIESLAKQYGALDGENVYYYATHFAEVMNTLTDAQKADLMELRDLDNYPCSDSDIYVYSEKETRPEIEDTDFLFE